MIPKRVHYCWLSGEPYPEKMRRCMASWKKVLPDYEFVLWDAEKVPQSDWVMRWVAAGNYAFACDYVRIWALYHEGGIYLDADVEVLRPFGELLDGELMLGEEGGSGAIEAAVMGAAKGNAAIGRVLDSFGETPVREGETLPQRMRRVLGDDIELLPEDVLSPKSWKTGKVNLTQRTRTVHHFAGTWLSAKERAAQRAWQLLGEWAVPCVRWLYARFGK